MCKHVCVLARKVPLLAYPAAPRSVYIIVVVLLLTHATGIVAASSIALVHGVCCCAAVAVPLSPLQLLLLLLLPTFGHEVMVDCCGCGQANQTAAAVSHMVEM